MYFFFFSSRRRHTRYWRDWSSDVCSSDLAPGQETGGVKVAQIVDDPAPMRMVYEPGNPMADAKGYVQMPNVDVVSEMVNTISASRSYQANVEVLNTTKSLMMKTLTLGQ